MEFERQDLYHPTGEVQHKVKVVYNGETLSGTLDEYDKDNQMIKDDKTSASLAMFQKWIPKYKRQLAYYQMLIEMRDGIKC